MWKKVRPPQKPQRKFVFHVNVLVAMTSHVVWLVSRGCPCRYSFTTTTTTNVPPRPPKNVLYKGFLAKIDIY